MIKSCALRTRYDGGQSHRLELRKDDLANSLTSALKDSLVIEEVGAMEPIKLGGLWGARQAGSLWDANTVAPTIKTASGGYSQPLIIDEQTKGDAKMAGITRIYPRGDFRYVSLFSGVGGFEQGLNRLGGTCSMASEIDKYADQAYEVLYGHTTVGDVTKVVAHEVPDHNLLVGGFPCQAFSVAGKKLGFDDTRGTMFFEMARIAKEKQPKVILGENVKGLVGHDKGRTLDAIVQTLNEIGYRVDFEVLNSKYFDVPQNRERIFILAVREDLVENEPWKIAGNTVAPKGKRRISQYEGVKTFNFDWPTQEAVTTRLRDILETVVDEKYYLSDEKTAVLVAKLNEDQRENTPKIVHNIYGGFNEAKPRVFEGESPTIRTSAGGGHLPSVLEQYTQGEGISLALDASYHKGLAPGRIKSTRTHVMETEPKYRIRKLTPLECFRLQGFDDEVPTKLREAGISDTQLYKMAGNAVTVNVIEAIGARLIASGLI